MACSASLRARVLACLVRVVNSEFIPAKEIANPMDLELWLKVRGRWRVRWRVPRLTCRHLHQVDGVEKQRGSTSKMIFNVPYLIHYVSNIMSLQHGDIILTGTPEGVGPVRPGQVCVCVCVWLCVWLYVCGCVAVWPVWMWICRLTAHGDRLLRLASPATPL